jgi:hypothetical protein
MVRASPSSAVARRIGSSDWQGASASASAICTKPEIAKQNIDLDDIYVLPELRDGETVECCHILRRMSPDQIRQAVQQLMDEASHSLGHADSLATCAAGQFPGEQFSRVIPCLSIGLPLKDPDHPLCIRELRLA